MPVVAAHRDRVAVLTLDSARGLNVLSGEMLDELEARLDEVEAEGAAGAVVLTGAGTRAFSAGADVAAMRGMGPAEARALSAHGQRVADRLESLRVPVVAAINGVCVGGGCELALACDVRVCAASARIGLPEVTLGIVPGWGGSQRLARLVGVGLATEMILTGSPVDSDVALRHGLVTHVHPPEELHERAIGLAGELASRPPLALAAARELIRGAAGHAAAGLAHERDAFGLVFASEDAAEGVAAFLDKRSAQFRGR